jgi:hypothetical protein
LSHYYIIGILPLPMMLIFKSGVRRTTSCASLPHSTYIEHILAITTTFLVFSGLQIQSLPIPYLYIKFLLMAADASLLPPEI